MLSYGIRSGNHMNGFELITDMSSLRKTLEKDLMKNAVFINKVFESDLEIKCYSDTEEKAFVSIQKGGEYIAFGGDWSDVNLPVGLLPENEFFTPACPGLPFKKLTDNFEIKESWPCWQYTTSKGFGKGPWDELDRLEPDDVSVVEKYWDLKEDAGEYLRDRLSKFESACVRIEGELVSWAGMHFEIDGLGEMGFAHTLEKHRGKGLATSVTKALVNRITAHGNIVMCYMFKTNEASISMCEKLGFKRSGEGSWAVVGSKL